ncbi:uncharacterized protein LOC132638030 [Lycium barbarum]|uniref:uncharacterized protein LOC132638030 n=1 Tax=Lycium barbarum TaxID=112863 RepID=UPI00293EF027|nr:uncharacterized protein LOC132638030 [Lycium barbarum]
MDENDEFWVVTSPPSLKQKLKNSLCFSCCFPHRRPPPPQPSSSDENPGLIWFNPEEPSNLPNLKDKVLTALSFVGNRHKRHSSTEFRYDPLSYSLNFEDGFSNNNDEEEAPLRNFSSRLPPSPPVKPMSVREVTAAT